MVMGVDGFRFDEAATLGRNGAADFSGQARTLRDISALAKARGFKIYAEPWDANDGNEMGRFPEGWGAWNGSFRDTVRDFARGIASTPNGVGYADAFGGDEGHFKAEGGPALSVNMIDCHDGFLLTDLVSYDVPTGPRRAWPFGPSDGGTRNNRSSSWGGNQALRRQTIRNLMAFQALSRGVPMRVWGDEFGRTANGNNNAYNVDSLATWNNYAMIASDEPDAVPTGEAATWKEPYADNLGRFEGGRNQNFLFQRFLLKLRSAHSAFRQADYLMPIHFADADGGAVLDQASCLTPRIYLVGSEVGDHDFLFMANMTGVSRTFSLPTAPNGSAWLRLFDTDHSAEADGNCWSDDQAGVVENSCEVHGHSEVLLMAR
jgi:glycogen operon protein